MQLSKTELRVLEQMAKGNKTIIKIAQALKKSDKQIYVTTKQLIGKGIIERKDGIIEPNKTPHITLLLQLLSEYPNLYPVLSNSGIPVLTALLKPSTIEEITAETGIKRAMIYRKLKEANKRSIITKMDSSFKINETIWGKMKDFLEELRKYELTIDERIPASSKIYYKKKEEIVFSCKEKVDAIKTAFSGFGQYDIKLMLTTNYYYLPKERLNKEDILKHSLYVTEKDLSIRNLIFIALFYAKYRKEFKIKHPILMNLDVVLAGKKIEGYPSYNEIKDRAEVYGIEV